MAENLVTTSSVTRDNLVSGSFPLITKQVTIISGQNVVRGTLMGKIDLSGKFNKSLLAAIDGSEVPHSILVRDVDASLGDKLGEVYLSGQFNQNDVTFGTGHTIANTVEGLRNLGIYLESVKE